eukprot:scaffold21320_cov18-Prasinocladus_malaysianus.AAC.1
MVDGEVRVRVRVSWARLLELGREAQNQACTHIYEYSTLVVSAGSYGCCIVIDTCTYSSD